MCIRDRLTEVFARRIFGHDNPIGKVLHYSNGTDITAVSYTHLPDARTGRLGGEERYKNLILPFRQNAFTIVTDSD